MTQICGVSAGVVWFFLLRRRRRCSSWRVRGQARREPSQPSGTKTADPEALGKDLGEAVADRGGHGAQHRQGQLAEGFLEALTGLAGASASLVPGDVEGAGGFQAFGPGVAGAPGHDQQDEDERLRLPAPARRWGTACCACLPAWGVRK